MMAKVVAVFMDNKVGLRGNYFLKEEEAVHGETFRSIICMV
jgi:hypothetical protein